MEPGFTLIELLIVIVVLGILAATVIFALTGITGQSAQAACQSDAKTYEIAVSAYENSPENPSNAVPTTTNQLLADSNGGPFLHAAANNTAYIVALNGDSVTDNTTGVNNTAAGTTIPGGPPAPATGSVWVGVPGHALVDYDSETSTTGCNDSAL